MLDYTIERRLEIRKRENDEIVRKKDEELNQKDEEIRRLKKLLFEQRISEEKL